MGFLSVLTFVKSPLFRHLLIFVACAAGYWYFVYMPTYHRGYKKAHAEQQAVIDRLIEERNKDIEERNARVKDVEQAAAKAKEELVAEKEDLNRKLATITSDYQRAKAKLRLTAPKNQDGNTPGVNVPLVVDGKFFAPIDAAGLSKPGVDAVNQMLLEASQ